MSTARCNGAQRAGASRQATPRAEPAIARLLETARDMLTLIDAVCVAGDRAKQNDDAWGLAEEAAFVIDGATDLHDHPFMPAASDASWLARFAAARLSAEALAADPRGAVGRVGASARAAFQARVGEPAPPRWAWPTAALLIAAQTPEGLEVHDLGDCRIFTLGADGVGAVAGGEPRGKDDETARAAQFSSGGGGNARYRSPEALAHLRALRDLHNLPEGYAIFGIDPACAARMRLTRLTLARPAYALLATDGFAALADVYEAFDPAALVRAAREHGLAALVDRLRAIEQADAGATRHPRWKRSDDATAVLLRLD